MTVPRLESLRDPGYGPHIWRYFRSCRYPKAAAAYRPGRTYITVPQLMTPGGGLRDDLSVAESGRPLSNQ